MRKSIKKYTIIFGFLLVVQSMLAINLYSLTSNNIDIEDTKSVNLTKLPKSSLKWELNWSKTFNQSSFTTTSFLTETAADVTVDATDSLHENIYVTGYYANDSNYKDEDIFLLKYDKQGNLIFNRSWGGSRQDRASAIWFYENTEDEDFVFILGHTNTSSDVDTVLLKYNTTGHLKDSITWGYLGSNEYGKDFAFGNNGRIFITGETDKEDSGNSDIYLAQLDFDGTNLWNDTWGETGHLDYINGLTIDYGDGSLYNHEIYITGGTESYGAEMQDLILLKYNITGDFFDNYETLYLKWNKTYGTTIYDWGMDVDWEDAHEYVYVTGTNNSFSDPSAPTPGGDILLLKFNRSGDLEWDKSYSGESIESIGNAILTISDTVYISGRWKRNASLLTYRTDGEFLSINTTGTEEYDEAYGIARYSDQNNMDHIYIAGYYNRGPSTEADVSIDKFSMTEAPPSPPSDDNYEENDILSAAYLLNLPFEQWLVSNAADPDYFNISLNEGDKLNIDIFCDISDPDNRINLTLFNKSLSEVNSSSCTFSSTDTIIRHTIDSSGTYTLLINQTGSVYEAYVDYDLKVSVIPEEDEKEEDDDIDEDDDVEDLAIVGYTVPFLLLGITFLSLIYLKKKF